MEEKKVVPTTEIDRFPETEKIKSLRLRDKKSLEELLIILKACSDRLSLIGSLFCQMPPDYEPELNRDDVSGLYHILDDVQGDINLVVSEIYEKEENGLIVEKEVGAE